MIQHPEAELALLGAILLDPACLMRVRPLVPDPLAFSSVPGRAIYTAALRIADRREPLEYVHIGAELAKTGGLQDWELRCSEALDAAVTSANAEAHARMVQDAYRRRLVHGEAERLRLAAGDLAVPLGATVASVVDRMVGHLRDARGQRAHPLLGDLVAVMDRLEQQAGKAGILTGVSTGFAKLDRLTGGWHPGELIVLAGRTSQGKTACGLHFARAAATSGPVYVASREMTSERLAARLLSAESGINLRRCGQDADYFSRSAPALADAGGVLARLPITLDERAATPAQIRFEVQCMMAHTSQRPALVVVDYLQLLHPDSPAQNRDREIGEITRALKLLAADIQAPVVLLSQLSRGSARENRKPQTWDLRDSGNIEQDADLIPMLYWRDDQPETGPRIVDLLLRKNRDGEIGEVPLCFEGRTQRWWDATDRDAA